MSLHLSDAEVIAQHNHLEMMRRPHLWTWEFLPLIRERAGRKEHAVLRRRDPDRAGPWIITEGTPNKPVGLSVAVSDLTQITNAGWEVD